jgi:hypothetical protein
VADVGVTVTGPGAVVPGGAYSINSKLANNGVVVALTAQMTVDVSGGSTVTGVNDAACSFTATTVTCNYSGFGPGQVKNVAISLAAPVTLGTGGLATVTQHAHETALFDNVAIGPDGNPSNDDSTLTTQVYTSDVGVTLAGAQPAVTNGLDQGLTATIANLGSRTQAAMSLVVATGGKVDNDANAPLPANCSVSGLITNQTVTCAYSNVAGGTTQAPVRILVTTPLTGSSMSSTATKTQSVPEFGGSTANDTATVVTSLSTSAPCGTSCTQFVVKNGGTVSRTSPQGDITQTFSVPANATWTGGWVKVTLREINSTFTCGGAQCYSRTAESKSEPLNSTSTPDPNTPLRDEVTYLVNQVCGGNGYPSGCLPIYFLPTNTYVGDATLVPRCVNYGTGTFVASADPCVQQTTKLASNKVKHLVLYLRDISLPILGK